MADFGAADPACAPTVVLAGAPKTGTTALADALGQHPSVILSAPKEPRFLYLGPEHLRNGGTAQVAPAHQGLPARPSVLGGQPQPDTNPNLFDNQPNPQQTLPQTRYCTPSGRIRSNVR